MSEQRRIRSELKQGLHQFLMSLYKTYTQSLSHEDAVEQVTECLKEEFSYFTKQDYKDENSSFDFQTMIHELEAAARKELDAFRQMELYNQVEILSNAQDIIQEFATREERS